MNEAKKKADELVSIYYDLVEDRAEGVMISRSPSARCHNAVTVALITVHREIRTLEECRKCFNGGSEMYESLLLDKKAVKEELESRL